MALIKCPECGKKISDTVDTCIHCGYPLENLNNLEAKQELANSNSITDLTEDPSSNDLDVKYSIKDYLIYLILVVGIIILIVFIVFILKIFQKI